MKKMVVHYSSHRNITFAGEDVVFEIDDDEYETWLDKNGEVRQDILDEAAQDWLADNVDVFVEVIGG